MKKPKKRNETPLSKKKPPANKVQSADKELVTKRGPLLKRGSDK